MPGHTWPQKGGPPQLWHKNSPGGQAASPSVASVEPPESFGLPASGLTHAIAGQTCAQYPAMLGHGWHQDSPAGQVPESPPPLLPAPDDDPPLAPDDEPPLAPDDEPEPVPEDDPPTPDDELLPPEDDEPPAPDEEPPVPPDDELAPPSSDETPNSEPPHPATPKNSAAAANAANVESTENRAMKKAPCLIKNTECQSPVPSVTGSLPSHIRRHLARTRAPVVDIRAWSAVTAAPSTLFAPSR